MWADSGGGTSFQVPWLMRAQYSSSMSVFQTGNLEASEKEQGLTVGTIEESEGPDVDLA